MERVLRAVGLQAGYLICFLGIHDAQRVEGKRVGVAGENKSCERGDCQRVGR